MTGYGLGVILAVLVFLTPSGVTASEFSGKLERLGFDTVTLLGQNNDKKTGKICHEQRIRAARFLGKSVTVNFEKQQGEEWAVSFEALK